MAQLETEKLTKQLAEALKLEQVLSQINPDTKHQQVGLGSLVTTTNGQFFIADSLGQVTINDVPIFAISNVSPIGKLLIGLKKEDSFSFNGKSYTILSIN